MKEFFKDYFRFSKKERIGTLVILFLIFSGISAPVIYKYFSQPDKLQYITYNSELDSLKSSATNTPSKTNFYKKNFNKYRPSTESYSPHLFYFDPNTLSDSGWALLKVKPKTILTIRKYLKKGGHFYSPTDLAKIYGLSENQKSILIPYVKIDRLADDHKKYTVFGKNKTKVNSIIDINSADSLELLKIPGIGPVYSNRIIKFRKRLGGFYSTDQLAEVYGLPDSTFQRIKSKVYTTDSLVKKINLNTATLEELKHHPYIHYQIGKAIIAYRNQHGPFKNLADLKNILIIPDQLQDKLAHYLSIN